METKENDITDCVKSAEQSKVLHGKTSVIYLGKGKPEEYHGKGKIEYHSLGYANVHK